MILTMLTRCLDGGTHPARGLVSVGMAGMLAGCIQISAPERPIEINLNVTIRQEVVVSLRDDVKNLDQQFPGVF